jgi:alpha-amylase/alpha-mannosidase (GH57 family)
MSRYLCIHGHFYQPPRENPWLEDIEQQDSAYPFHDWNERITVECYEPNGAARILDKQRQIAAIVNNYARTSFNFGPTLLSWLEKERPVTYRRILDADRLSRERFGGHGAALAQPYNHLIMPLATPRDRQTQIHWGLADFRRRFGREAEGMWLPEAAVDVATLELLAAYGLRFTVLAPHQARRVRRHGESRWQELNGAEIDPRRPYRCRLPSGAEIVLFFYDGPIARDVAFSRLLDDGERFASRLVDAFGADSAPQLVHIATDGETYGHHHRFGEMALAYCLDILERRKLARLTIYGEFLALHPPEDEVEIRENSSWSCAHGVERWRSDCGCHIGGEADWTQSWRAPLRQTLDWLRDSLIPLFESGMAPFCTDPWAVRDAYIEIILDRSTVARERFLAQHLRRPIDETETVRLVSLLEMQRHAQLMYTSCGWFFDEVSGIETTQILAYAARALQLAEETCAVSLEKEFLARLEKVPSNLRRIGNAARLYAGQIAPARLDLARVAAHHAIVASFAGDCDTQPHRHILHCYSGNDCSLERVSNGRMQLTIGNVLIRSEITRRAERFSFAVLNLGSHAVTAGVGPGADRTLLTKLREELVEPFRGTNIAEVVRAMDRYFGTHNYNLLHLFKDEQRRVLQQLMAKTLDEVEGSFRGIYENHVAFLRFLHQLDIPTPRLLALPAELVLIGRFRTLFESSQPQPEQLRSLADEVEALAIPLDEPMLGLAAGRQLLQQLDKLAIAPRNLALLLTIIETLEILSELPFELDLWQAQNRFWEILHEVRAEIPATAVTTAGTDDWQAGFRRLGTLLQVQVP